MYNHAPEDYVCPFCLVVCGIENEHVLTNQADIIYKDEHVTAFIGAATWGMNHGNVIIVPNEHFENIYDLPAEYAHKIHDLEKEVALAFKQVYKCDGVSSRQHNEPAGNQDVWHYHLHVFPRYKEDQLYKKSRETADPQERAEYAKQLRDYLKNNHKHNEV